MAKGKFSVIETYKSLLITKEALEKNIELISAGHRFDNSEGGHNEFVDTIQKSLSIVNQRLKVLEK